MCHIKRRKNISGVTRRHKHSRKHKWMYKWVSCTPAQLAEIQMGRMRLLKKIKLVVQPTKEDRKSKVLWEKVQYSRGTLSVVWWMLLKYYVKLLTRKEKVWVFWEYLNRFRQEYSPCLVWIWKSGRESALLNLRFRNFFMVIWITVPFRKKTRSVLGH